MNLNTPIWEIMSSQLSTVKEDTPFKKVKDLFRKKSIHHIPVNNRLGELVGIISTEDMPRIEEFDVDEEYLTAKHIMTTSVMSVEMDTTIKEVIQLFLDNRFRALPIASDKGVLIGIVTPFDFMKIVKQELEKTEI